MAGSGLGGLEDFPCFVATHRVGAAGQGPLRPGDRDEPRRGHGSVGGDGLGGEVDMALDFFVGPADAGETVTVSPLDPRLCHPGGVVVVPVGDDCGLLFLVSCCATVDEVRCHLAGRHVDDQDRLRAVGQLEYVQVRQVGLNVVADPLGILLPVDFLGVDAHQGCCVTPSTRAGSRRRDR